MRLRYISSLTYKPINRLRANPTKRPNTLKTIRRRIADELFECV